jgi:transposase
MGGYAAFSGARLLRQASEVADRGGVRRFRRGGVQALLRAAHGRALASPPGRHFRMHMVGYFEGIDTSVAKTLGISGQTLHNWMKAEAAGRSREVAGKMVSTEQMEIDRLKAELAKTRMERDIVKKAGRILRESRGEIRLCRATSKSLADKDAMSGAERQRQRLSSISRASDKRRRFPSARSPDRRCGPACSCEGDFQ